MEGNRVFSHFSLISISPHNIGHRLAHVQRRPCRWLGGSRLECPRPEMLLLGEILKFLSLRPRAADRPWLLTAAGPWPWQRRAQGEEAARGRAQPSSGSVGLRQLSSARHTTARMGHQTLRFRYSQCHHCHHRHIILSSPSWIFKLSVCKHTIISSKQVDSKPVCNVKMYNGCLNFLENDYNLWVCP